jgi:hypothetical protein
MSTLATEEFGSFVQHAQAHVGTSSKPFEGQWRAHGAPESRVAGEVVEWSYLEGGCGPTRVTGEVGKLLVPDAQLRFVALHARFPGGLTEEVAATHDTGLWWNLHARKETDLLTLFARLDKPGLRPGLRSRVTRQPLVSTRQPPPEHVDSPDDLAAAIRMLGTAPLGNKLLTLEDVYAATRAEWKRTTVNVKLLHCGKTIALPRDNLPPTGAANRLRAALQLASADATGTNGAWLVGWGLECLASGDPQHLGMGALFAHAGFLAQQAASMLDAGIETLQLADDAQRSERKLAPSDKWAGRRDQASALRVSAREDYRRAEVLSHRATEGFSCQSATIVQDMVTAEMDELSGAGSDLVPDRFLRHGCPALLGHRVTFEAGADRRQSGIVLLYNRVREQVVIRIAGGVDVLAERSDVAAAE